MRLLTVKQVKDRKNKRNEDLRVASNKITEALIERTNKMNRLDASYKTRQADLTAKYHKEVKQYTLQLKELDSEVQILEKRKREALGPLKEFEQELNDRRDELNNRENNTNTENERLEILQSSLSTKTNQLDTQELYIEKQIKVLDKRQKTCEKDEKQVKRRRRDVATQSDSLQIQSEKLAKKSEEVDKKNNEKQREIKALYLNLDEKKSKLDKQEKIIVSERAKVDSIVQELKDKSLWQK